MTLWVRVRRWWLLPVALVVWIGLLLLVREQVAKLPAITLAGSPQIKLMNFVPLVICVSVAYCLGRRLLDAEVTGVRPVVTADRLMVGATGAAVVVLGYLLGEALDMPSAAAAGRNTVLLLGVTLLVRAWFGAALGAAGATLWLMANVLAGLQTPGHPYPWATLLMHSTQPFAAAVAALAFAAGLGPVWSSGHEFGGSPARRDQFLIGHQSWREAISPTSSGP
jgi:hypothetical protein